MVAHVYNYAVHIYIKQKHTMLLYHSMHNIPTHKYRYDKDIKIKHRNT